VAAPNQPVAQFGGHPFHTTTKVGGKVITQHQNTQSRYLSITVSGILTTSPIVMSPATLSFTTGRSSSPEGAKSYITFFLPPEQPISGLPKQRVTGLCGESAGYFRLLSQMVFCVKVFTKTVVKARVVVSCPRPDKF